MQQPNKRKIEGLEQLKASRSSKERKRTRTSMLLASIISKALKEKKISNGMFAERMDQHPSVITKWLSGVHNFTTDTLSDIEEVLEISLLNLTKEELNPTIIINASYNVIVLTKVVEGYSELTADAHIPETVALATSEVFCVSEN